MSAQKKRPSPESAEALAAGLGSPAKAPRVKLEDQGTPPSGGSTGGGRIEEYTGDLFEGGLARGAGGAPYSFCHSIGQDMVFKAPVAAAFAQRFRRLEELKAQKKKVGEVAVLRVADGTREFFTYNLVTKHHHKVPTTVKTLEVALEAMRQHALQNGVHRIAMPRLGCGMDKLEWGDVQRAIRKVFFLQPTGPNKPPFQILVCSKDPLHPPAADAGAVKAEAPDGVKMEAPGGGAGAVKVEAPGGDAVGKGHFEEHRGDLFNGVELASVRQGGDHFSLAHCVSVDMVMGKGIATAFKQKFGRVDQLKKQGKDVGEVAVLSAQDSVSGRPYYIYYLITKERYMFKPTLQSLELSLEAMRKHALANGVSRIAMPRIGCGLDRLRWEDVSKLLRRIFWIDQPAVGKPPFDIRIFTL